MSNIQEILNASGNLSTSSKLIGRGTRAIFMLFCRWQGSCCHRNQGSIFGTRDIYSNKVKLLVKIDRGNLVKLLFFTGKEHEYMMITEYVLSSSLQEYLDGK